MLLNFRAICAICAICAMCATFTIFCEKKATIFRIFKLLMKKKCNFRSKIFVCLFSFIFFLFLSVLSFLSFFSFLDFIYFLFPVFSFLLSFFPFLPFLHFLSFSAPPAGILLQFRIASELRHQRDRAVAEGVVEDLLRVLRLLVAEPLRRVPRELRARPGPNRPETLSNTGHALQLRLFRGVPREALRGRPRIPSRATAVPNHPANKE